MKKILFLSVCIAALSSCVGGSKQDALKNQKDSLMIELANRDAELDDIMATFNEVQEGFRLINEAENRVDLQGGKLTERRSNSAQVKEDIRFISDKMQENREQIAKLEKQLKNSNYNSAQLKKAIATLNKELEAKQQQIETLQKELSSKNIRIAELDDAVAGLNENVKDLAAKHVVKDATIAGQDKMINSAWFVFGTKSELKTQKILEKGDVLKSGNFNQDYFTKIDIRTDTEIKLFSKRAELLTTHPAGSYKLEKNEKSQMVLKINNPTEFWSVSRYLVIQVR
ncbi:MAG: hypothetical protein ACRCZY_08095 [Phocaeicola sp.]